MRHRSPGGRAKARITIPAIRHHRLPAHGRNLNVFNLTVTLPRCPLCGGRGARVRAAAFAVEICCIAIRPPQQICSGASTHPGPATQATQIPTCPRRTWEVMQPGRGHHAGKARAAARRRRRPGSGALPRVFAEAVRSGAAPGVVRENPRRSEAAGTTWSGILQHGHRGRRRRASGAGGGAGGENRTEPNRAGSGGGGRRECGAASFPPSACHLSISLGRCGSVTRRLRDDRQPARAHAPQTRSPLATARERARDPVKLVRGPSVTRTQARHRHFSVFYSLIFCDVITRKTQSSNLLTLILSMQWLTGYYVRSH